MSDMPSIVRITQSIMIISPSMHRGFLALLYCMMAMPLIAGITEIEPNNTLSTANTITWDTPTATMFSAARIFPLSDLDFYKITLPAVPAGTRIRIVMTPTGADGALDAGLRILSSTGVELQNKDSGGDNRSETCEIEAASFQSYHIQCRSTDWSSSGSGEYTLAIALFVPPAITRVYWITPNQTLTCFDGTEVLLYAELQGFNVGDSVTFRLYEHDFASDDAAGVATTTVQSSSGQLYAAVRWKAEWQDDGSGDPEFYFTVEGRALWARSDDLNVTPGEPDDKLVTAETLESINQSVVVPDTISVPDDVDMYAFQANAGQRITFDVDRPTGTLLPLLRLFDANGNELKRNSGGSNPVEVPANEAFIEYSFTNSAKYFVGVSGLGNGAYDPKTGLNDGIGSTGDYKLCVSPGLAGHIRKYQGGTNYLVDLLRVDDPSAPIEGTKTTWVLVHGWTSSRTESNIAELAAALGKARPSDQVLTLDWSTAAGAGILSPGNAAEGIVPTASWAAKALQGAGIMGHQLNLVGHSFGAYVVNEIAKRYPGKVNSIVALDPAANAVSSIYDPVANDNVNFARDAQWSWAFHSSSLGNEFVPGTANEAFIFRTGFIPTAAHNAIVDFFAYAVLNPSDPICGLFGLNNLLDRQYGPWVLNQYEPRFLFDYPWKVYEAEISSENGRAPSTVTYACNAPLAVVESPAAGSFVTGSPILIRGTATDAGRGGSGIASVTVNGVRAYAGPGGQGETVTWAATVPVFLGTNQVQVVTTDTSTPNVGKGTNTHSVIYLPAFLDVPSVQVRLGSYVTTNLATGDLLLSERPLSYLLESGPSGLTVTADGILKWQPSAGQAVGTNQVIVRVTDGTVTTRKRMSAILGARNAEPVIVPIPIQYLAPGEALALDIQSTDADVPAQSLTYTLVQGPPGFGISPLGQAAWNVPQSPVTTTHVVAFTVSDGVDVVHGRLDIVVLGPPILSQSPRLGLSPTGSPGSLELQVTGPTGSVLLLESSDGLVGWREDTRIPTDGMDKVVRIPRTSTGSDTQRFWRIRNLGQR